MGKPIRIEIQAAHNHGADAPGVWELVNSLSTSMKMIECVEDEVIRQRGSEPALSGGRMLHWQVTGLSKRSPCNITLTPQRTSEFPPSEFHKVLEEVVGATANGLHSIATLGEAHAGFPTGAMAQAQQLCKQVLNGLGTFTIDFSEYKGLPNFVTKRKIARRSVVTIQALMKSVQTQTGHQELGSVEGYVTGIQRNARGHPVLQIRSRLDNSKVNCLFPADDLGSFGEHEVKQLVRDMRVNVSGVITYRDLDHIENIEVEDIYIYDAEENLPPPESIVAPNFTGGLEAVAYLAEIRNDD